MIEAFEPIEKSGLWDEELAVDRQVLLAGLPESLVLFSCSYAENQAGVQHMVKQGVALPQSLTRARPKRQAEFLAGRYCASMALQHLGSSVTDVGVHDDRSPIWPLGYVGSITHSAGLAMAAVGPQQVIRAVGIDAEQWVSTDQAASLGRAVLLPGDEQLRDTRQLPKGWFFTLAFSAKESLYKLLWPEVGSFFGFEAAVIVSIDERHKSFTIKLTETLSEQWVAGQSFSGTYIATEQYIVTLLFIGLDIP